MQKVKELLSGDSHKSSTTTQNTTNANTNTPARFAANTDSSPTATTGAQYVANNVSTAGSNRNSGLTGDSARVGDSGLTGDSARVGSSGLAGNSGLTGHGTSNVERSSTTGTTDASRTTGSNVVQTGKGLVGGARDHTHGHTHSPEDTKLDMANTKHDHQHLAAVTDRTVHHHEVEEVQRERELDRNVHHVQHHVQPVLDRQEQATIHHQKVAPVTTINEKHSSNEQDKVDFANVAGGFQNQETHRPTEKTIVDKGEIVRENVQHHVHHVTQPVVQQEVHEKHHTHTVIPIHQTSHEAPIIHKSSHHEPITMDAFQKGGGTLDSGITHRNAGVLNDGDCVRTVDGPNA